MDQLGRGGWFGLGCFFFFFRLGFLFVGLIAVFAAGGV